MSSTRPVTIAVLPLDQRPRERLLELGADALTDAELIALVLGTGRRGMSSVELAHTLLRDAGGLGGLASCDPVALSREPGVGPAKSARVVAALTLARRLARATGPDDVVASSADIARLVGPLLADRRRERVVVVVCDARNRVRARVIVAEGAAGSAPMPVREVLAEVLRRDGVAFAVAHNHPGGDPTPSAEDRRATFALAEAATRCGLRFLDHVIVAGEAWRSAQ